MENNKTSEQVMLELAKERVRRIKKFYDHFFIYIIGLGIYLAKTYLGAPLNFFPIRYINETFMWCWTFVFGIQGIKLFFIENVFGTNWEKRQLKKEMENQSSRTNKWE